MLFINKKSISLFILFFAKTLLIKKTINANIVEGGNKLELDRRHFNITLVEQVSQKSVVKISNWK